MVPGRHLEPRRRHLALSVALVAAGLVAAVTMPVDADPDEPGPGERSAEVRRGTDEASTGVTDGPVPDPSSATSVVAPTPSAPAAGAPTTTAPAPAAPEPTAPTSPPATRPPAAVAAVGTPAPQSPCGGSLPRRGGGTWSCVFSDEFSGTSLDRGKWTVLTTETTGHRVGGLCVLDRPENVSVSGEALQLTVRKEQERSCPYGREEVRTPYTGSLVSTMGKFSMAFGRYEIRAKFPSADVPGLHGAFWLWPEANNYYGVWPVSGEIDVAEAYSKFPDRVIPHVHYLGGALTSRDGNNFCIVGRHDEWHTYVLEWTPQTIRIEYDGRLCMNLYWVPLPPLFHPQPFDRPFYLNLTQGLGVAGSKNAFEPGRTPLPATMTVDYVRVWR